MAELSKILFMNELDMFFTILGKHSCRTADVS